MTTRKSILLLALLLLTGLLQGQIMPLQQHSKGKIFLRSGMAIEGTDLKIYSEQVTLEVDGTMQQFALDDVSQIMAKSGKGKHFGQRCAGSCAGCYVILALASGGKSQDPNTGETRDINVGQYVAEMALMSGISYGVGYLIGNISDDWEVVYLKP